MDGEAFLVILIIAAGLGFIPATIAKKKGREKFWLWWLYGWLLFIVALIHSIVMEDYNAPKTASRNVNYPPASTADELKKYKELFDSGAITQEEYENKKRQILNS